MTTHFVSSQSYTETALTVASEVGNNAVVKALLSFGANKTLEVKDTVRDLFMSEIMCNIFRLKFVVCHAAM